MPADIAPPPPGAPYYGPQSKPSAVSAGGSGIRSTTADRSSGASLAPPSVKSKIPLSYIMVAIVTVLVVVFGIWHPSIPGLGTQPAAIATPFIENFHDNTRGWLATSQNGLTASPPGNGKYLLTTDGNVSTIDYLFSYPNPAAVGTLPGKFTLTVQMTQNTGDPSAFYGLVFRFKQDNSGNVYCYAFVINSNGNYNVWKFDPNAPVKPTPLYGAQLPSTFHSGLNQSNILRAVVQGNTFSFMVNGIPVPLSNGSPGITDPSSPYTGGQPALLVSGPNSQFTVTQVQLAIP